MNNKTINTPNGRRPVNADRLPARASHVVVLWEDGEITHLDDDGLTRIDARVAEFAHALQHEEWTLNTLADEAARRGRPDEIEWAARLRTAAGALAESATILDRYMADKAGRSDDRPG